MARRKLRLRGAPVLRGSRAFEIIGVLVQSAGELINKNDGALEFPISAICKALGSNRAMLKTDSGRGCRLLGTRTAQQDSKPVDARDREPRGTSVLQCRTNVPLAA